MNIALALTGHLRMNPLNCIQSSLNFLKNYSTNLDTYINTYDVIGSHVKSKNYSTVKTEYTYDSENAHEVLNVIEKKFNPKRITINTFDDYQNDIIIPKTNKLIERINNSDLGPSIKNPGMLTGLIAQSTQRKDILQEIFKSEKKYDAILITRPDVNLSGLSYVDLNDEIYHLQSTPFFEKDRSVYLQNNIIQNKIAKKFKIGRTKTNLIGDILFFGKYEYIYKMYDLFFKSVEEVMYEIYKTSPEFMTYTYGPTFKTIPNWEMPEFIISRWGLTSLTNFKKIAIFDLKNDDQTREFVLHKNI